MPIEAYHGYITDVSGIKVGHSQSMAGMTGCTVIICEKGAVAGVDVRGSAPGTRETDLLKPGKTVDRFHAVVLSGGSAFGLDAASGVMNCLEESGIGFDTGIIKVPIVSSAVIFDLNIGDHKIRPDYQMGYQAAAKASVEERRQGNIGCGTGATVGKILGPEAAMKSGLGSASLSVGSLTVAAIVAVNSFGDVFDYKTGLQIAGVFDYSKNAMQDTYAIMKRVGIPSGFSMTNTTIGVVATNAILTKAEANKLAEIAHNGFARSINPIHTSLDGDTIFAMATNEITANPDLVGVMASEAISRAITNAILYAAPCGGLTAYSALRTER